MRSLFWGGLLWGTFALAACAATGDPFGSDGDGSCSEGPNRCVDGVREVCQNGSYKEAPCGDATYCQSGSCLACECVPGETDGCTGNADISTCAADCSGFEPAQCDFGFRCDGPTGACVEQECPPATSACIDASSYHQCNDTGSEWGDPIICDPGKDCIGGSCIDPCANAASKKSNVGCEFWAVDMGNLPPRDTYVYAVAVANPSDANPMNVEVYDANGTEQQLLTAIVEPRGVEIIKLSGSISGQTGFYPGDAGFLGNGIGKGRAFRIKTDRPALATQFNPVGGAGGATTDASLLLPTHTIGYEYLHLAYNQGYGEGSSMNVVATVDDTQLTITPTVSTTAGSNGLPAMVANVPTTITLNKYDYVQIAVGPTVSDLSGSHIEADKPVAVFGGHTCANVPTTSTGACDHVEEQIFPLSTWGQTYVAARNPIRGAEPMLWRIVAAEDGTTVTFDPPIAAGGSVSLSAGEVFEAPAEMNDFYVAANKPILVAGYMYGCSAVTGSGGCPGDPYMVLMIPVEQYLNDYVFLVDSSYDADFAKLIRPVGAQVEVACLGIVPEERWTAVGSSGYEVAVIDMNPGEASCLPGANEATSSQPFGILVSGQASAASYGYPGGLALEEINIPD